MMTIASCYLKIEGETVDSNTLYRLSDEFILITDTVIQTNIFNILFRSEISSYT